MNDARTPSALAPGGLVLPALALLLAACRIAPPRASAEEDIALATGIAGAVSFRVEGDPLDAHRTETASLALADALRRALASDPRLQAALARVRAAQAEAELAGLLPNPILDLVLRFPEGGGTASLEAGLAADLLAVLQRPRRARAAGQRLQREAALTLAAALELVADVQQRYAEVQGLEALVVVLAHRSDVLARLRAVAQARLDLGEGTLPEVTTLDAEHAELALELTWRQRELRIARLALARRIGEPSGAAAWRLDPWGPPLEVPTAEQPWLDAALAARPEILAIEWEIRARENEEVLAGRQALEGASVGLDAERAADWEAGPGLAVPIPLLDTGGARRERARMLTSEERHRLTEIRRRVIEEARTALVALVGAQADLERVVAELVPLQQRRRDQVEEVFRAGFADVTALLLADQALQDAEARRIELEREVSSGLYRLQHAVGGPSSFHTVVAAAQQVQP